MEMDEETPSSRSSEGAVLGLSRVDHEVPEGHSVLEPDHPLMKHFQASLKVHLERQNSRLAEELLELGVTMKAKRAEREELGVSLYDLQQQICKQLNTMEMCLQETSTTAAKRQKVEAELEESRKELKVELDKFNRAQKKELELRSELESLVMLENQFKCWEREMGSDLVVSQRVSEKVEIDKKQLMENKQKQDIVLYKLTSEVSNLEAKLTMLESQIEVKEKEQRALSQSVAESGADLQVLDLEQRRLVQAWNAVVISMQHRDTVFAEVDKEHRFLDEELSNLHNEIGSYRAASREQIEKNEKLTEIVRKLRLTLRCLRNKFRSSELERLSLEEKLSEKYGMLQQTESSLEQVLLEKDKLQRTLTTLEREVQELTLLKVNLEDRALDKLQSRITQDKASKYMNRLVQELRDRNREQDLFLVSAENHYSQVTLDIEKQKAVLYRNQTVLDDTEKEVVAREKAIEKVTLELNRSKFVVCKKQGIVDNLTKKLEAIIDKAGGEELSPLEIKVNSLQKSIHELDERCEKLQQLWLRQQGQIVLLARRHDQLLQEKNILLKQVLILQQKNLKLEYSIQRHGKEAQEVSRSIDKLNHKLTAVNIKLNEKRGYKESLDKMNFLTQTEYVNTLKGEEMASLTLQADISDLQQEKQQLLQTLREGQGESLVWEKKLQMAVETKQTLERERSKEGEIGAMKSEIHRMQVRFSQLCRAQDKLIQDLEHCVWRRDAIVDGAEAREKKSVRGAHNTRVRLLKKMEDLRIKIKQVNNESKMTDVLIGEQEKKQTELMEQITVKQTQLKQLEDTAQEIEKQLEEGQLQKQQNLELLVRRQRKVRMYGEVKAGRHKLLYRNDQALDGEFQRQKAINADLISVIESLLSDFPSLRFTLTRTLNTLRSPSA
ncbi:coiled-coil domain-containing protein 40 [Anabrus simplex]|uniref:coiled-coil domain-containing protein 40 n=1 Tax=Anabrus simplex TaxID=316456 RepID=UPI0035A2ADB7